MIKVKYFKINAELIFVFSFFFLGFAHAENILSDIIEITADKNMEWDQSGNKILAIGDANVKSRKFLLKADKITGFYDGNIGNGNIKTLKADTNANFISEKITITADYIDYDFIKDLVAVRGINIYMEFKEGSINEN